MSEVFKILIHAPKDPLLLGACFPCIHQLKNLYPNSQIHIIGREEHLPIFEILGFEAQTYPYDDEGRSIFSIHKFAVNTHEIFNIDVYFDFEGSFKSAFLGFSFRAKNRVGFIKGMNKVFLTHKIEPLDTYRPDRKFMYLLEKFQDHEFPEYKLTNPEGRENLKTKSVEELANLPKYFFLDFKDIENQKELWDDFFRFFENQYFVIWFDPILGEEKYNELISYFKEKEQLNIYSVKTGPVDQYIKILTHAMAFLTDRLEWIYPTVSLEIFTYAFVNQATELPFMEHFERAPALIELKDNYPSKWIYAEENRSIETVDSLVNIIHDIHEL